MKIQVLGSGCPSCHKLLELTKQAVEELNLKEEVEYITDIQKIIEMGVMQSPVLAIDDQPALIGFVPGLEAIKEAIQQATENKKSNSCHCGGCC